jgi:colanic acid/amylovoran biosynthesis glycosyltransferase
LTRSGDRTHLLEVGLTWPPETFVQWKLQSLAERGFRVTVASLASTVEPGLELPGLELRRVRNSGFSLPRHLAGIAWDGAALAASDPARLRRLVASVRHPPVEPRRDGAVPALKRLSAYVPLARVRPDVVAFEWETAAVHYLPLFDVWRTPVVLSCRGSSLNVYPYSGGAEHWVRGYETAFARAAAVHVVSRAMQGEAERFGADPAKIHLILPGVDPDRFRPPEQPRASAGIFRMLSVGTLLWLKGHHYALEAVRELVDAGVDVRLDILGGDPGHETGHSSELRHLNFTIHDLGLAGRVQLHGDVPSSAVCDHMQAADVLLHASVSEGIPTVSLEAMACGLPLVVTDCGGIREVVADGVEGFVVPKRDVAGMTRALRRLSEDASLRERMGRAGRDRVLRHLTLARETDQFEQLYRGVAATGPVPPPAG